MNAVEYTHRLRRVATVSWCGALAVAFGLAALGVLALDEYLPFLALVAGSVPILVFVLRNQVVCEACGGSMRVSKGYPRIEYRCRRCGAVAATGIHADY